MPATLSPTTPICLDGEPVGTWAEFCADNADGLDAGDLTAIATALRGGDSYTVGGGAAAGCTITLAAPPALSSAPIIRAGAGRAHKARGTYTRATSDSIATFLAAERR